MGNDILIDLLKTFDPEHPNFRPTELYNEGWLLRIVLNEYSNHRITNQLLSFQQGATWFSEAMINSVLPPPISMIRIGLGLGRSLRASLTPL